MIALFIGSYDHIHTIDKRLIVHCDYLIGQFLRSDIAAYYAVGHAALVRRHVEFSLVDLEVPSYECDNYLVGVALDRVYYRLDSAIGSDTQQLAYFFDCLSRARIDEFEGSVGAFRRAAHAFRHFHIGSVVAAVAEYERILASLGHEHKLMRYAAAHHARIRLEIYKILKTYASEYAVIGVIHPLVIFIQVLLRRVKRISVLHSELAHSDKSSARARLVSELGLYLIDHKRQLSMR